MDQEHEGTVHHHHQRLRTNALHPPFHRRSRRNLRPRPPAGNPNRPPNRTSRSHGRNRPARNQSRSPSPSRPRHCQAERRLHLELRRTQVQIPGLQALHHAIHHYRIEPPLEIPESADVRHDGQHRQLTDAAGQVHRLYLRLRSRQPYRNSGRTGRTGKSTVAGHWDVHSRESPPVPP